MIYKLRFFREFITELVNCDKIVAAAVFGFFNDIDVGMLPYFDFVFASDTSTFIGFIYNALGKITEGSTQIASQFGGVPRAVVIIKHLSLTIFIIIIFWVAFVVPNDEI